MTDETQSDWWVPSYLLESLHRAGFTGSARDGAGRALETRALVDD